MRTFNFKSSDEVKKNLNNHKNCMKANQGRQTDYYYSYCISNSSTLLFFCCFPLTSIDLPKR